MERLKTSTGMIYIKFNEMYTCYFIAIAAHHTTTETTHCTQTHFTSQLSV